MQRVLRNKPPKQAGKKNKKKKSETVAMSSKKMTLSSELENGKQGEKSKGKEIEKDNENKKGRKEEGEQEQTGRRKRKEKMKRESIPVVQSNVKIGVSRSDICLFAHWVIGFLRHLNTEWVQIIFDIECSAEQENTNDYLLLSSCPSTPTLSNPYPSTPHESENFSSVYATWKQLERIRIRVQELPGISDQLILDHCVVLLEYFREKGVKEGSRWMWHPDEVELLDRFLGCEIYFWVGEEEAQDKKRESGRNDTSLQEGLGIECAVRGLQLRDKAHGEEFAGFEDAAFSRMTANPEANAAEARDAIPENGAFIDKDQVLPEEKVFPYSISIDSGADAGEMAALGSSCAVENSAAVKNAKDKDAAAQKEKVLRDVAPIYHSFCGIGPSTTSMATAISESMAAEKPGVTKRAFAQKSLVEENAAMVKNRGAAVQADKLFKNFAPLKNVEFAKTGPVAEANENVKDKDVKINKSIKKLEVIWEEEDQPTELMMALRAVGMVETGGFCYCWDRCALNKNLDPEIYEPAVAFPVRERMKIKRRNYQSEHSPDRFILKERKLLGIRRS